jgi:hypothetical protein
VQLCATPPPRTTERLFTEMSATGHIERLTREIGA